MFNFIGNILENITNFFKELIFLVFIACVVALLLIAGHRNRNNPYRDHTKERVEQQIEAEKEAKSKEALKELYELNFAK